MGTLVNVLNPRMVILGGLLQSVYARRATRWRRGCGRVALRACLDEVRLAGAPRAARTRCSSARPRPCGSGCSRTRRLAGAAAGRAARDDGVTERRTSRGAGATGAGRRRSGRRGTALGADRGRWLLDLCPPDYRGHAVLTRTRRSSPGSPAITSTGSCRRPGARSRPPGAELAEVVAPPVVTETLEAVEAEEARLLAARRGLGLVAQALRGIRFVPRSDRSRRGRWDQLQSASSWAATRAAASITGVRAPGRCSLPALRPSARPSARAPAR